MQLIKNAFIVLFLFCCCAVPKATLKTNDFFSIVISLQSVDGKIEKEWRFDNEWVYYIEGCDSRTDCKIKGTDFDKLARLLIKLDSSKFLYDYGCKKSSSIHGNNKFRLFSTSTYAGKTSHFNFTISNCFLDMRVDELVSILNSLIPHSCKIPVVPNVQTSDQDCGCNKYKLERNYYDLINE